MSEETYAEPTWMSVFLLDNPFRVVPPRQQRGDIVWADMSELKERIEQAIRFSFQTSPSNLVLNWGPYGGGKSHAALYYTQPTVLEQMAEAANRAPPLTLVLTIPRSSKDVIRGFYLDILGKLKMSLVGEAVSRLVEGMGDEAALQYLERLSGNDEFANALILLSGQPPRGQMLPANELALRRYFLLSAGRAELVQLGLARNIETASDMIALLTAMLNLLVAPPEESHGPRFSKLFLWLDEIEELITLPSREQAGLTSFLRDLIDYVPSNLTMFLNFTLKTPGKYEDIGVYITEALLSRARIELLFGELPHSEAFTYVRELLNHPTYRDGDLARRCPDALYPFDESGLDHLFSILTPVTPRAINETCTLLIEQALARRYLDEPSARIDSDFVEAQRGELPSVRRLSQEPD